jgi:RNA polymerase sigma factor (TIGR02999 family)
MPLSDCLQAGVGRLIDAARACWLSSAVLSSDREVSPKEIMESPATHDVTRLLCEWRNGDQQALAQLTPLVYDELRRLAAGYLRRERLQHTLQATALVNEAWVQLLGHEPPDWQNRAHFLGIAARLMRQILVYHARAHATAKRGQGAAALPLDEAQGLADKPPPAVLALDDALRDLAKFDERKSRIIELRYFGGLSMDEMAEVTGLSVATLRRELRMAEAWLGRQIQKR